MLDPKFNRHGIFSQAGIIGSATHSAAASKGPARFEGVARNPPGTQTGAPDMAMAVLTFQHRLAGPLY